MTNNFMPVLVTKYGLAFGSLLVPTIACGAYSLKGGHGSEVFTGLFHSLNLGLMYSVGVMIQ